MTLLLLCLLLGIIAGLRALTPLAVVCWGAHFGWLHFAGTGLGFINHTATLLILTVLAIAEIFNDKLPKTPARTAIPSLIARVLSGGCSAAAPAVSAGTGLMGAMIAGSLGAVLGTYGGFNIRHGLVTRLNIPDFAVALVEDLIAIVGGLLVVSHL